VIASIPSPTEGVWYLGPVPIRAYALAIMIGIVVAIWLGERRWIARGGRSGDVLDIAIWAVPFGIVGARAYHLITDWDNYFAAGREPLEALRIWEGGLSIWGAIAGGALGGWIAARRRGIPFAALADALAPGIVLAQAIGRWGNYFNNELYGRPTDLPWGLEVHQMQNFRAVRDSTGAPVLLDGGPFHPIFLYESLWAVGTALVLIWADRRFRMGHGRVFALYVALYTGGRTWIENLRIDDGGDVAGPAREFLGMRVNAWVSVALMIGAIAYIVISARLKPGRETVELPPLDEEPGVTSEKEEAFVTADEATSTTPDKADDGDSDKVAVADEGAATKSDDGVAVKGEGGVAVKAEDGTATKTEDGAATKAEDGAATKTEDGAATKTEHVAAAKTEHVAAAKTEHVAATKAQDSAATKAQDSAATKAEDGAATKAEDGAATKAKKSAATKTKKSAATKAGDGAVTESDAEGSSETDVENSADGESASEAPEPQRK
jgi:prolipoprotein diacylglyceryl transferase